jgi:hypothetical protein
LIERSIGILMRRQACREIDHRGPNKTIGRISVIPILERSDADGFQEPNCDDPEVAGLILPERMQDCL